MYHCRRRWWTVMVIIHAARSRVILGSGKAGNESSYATTFLPHLEDLLCKRDLLYCRLWYGRVYNYFIVHWTMRLLDILHVGLLHWGARHLSCARVIKISLPKIYMGGLINLLKKTNMSFLIDWFSFFLRGSVDGNLEKNRRLQISPAYCNWGHFCS